MNRRRVLFVLLVLAGCGGRAGTPASAPRATGPSLAAFGTQGTIILPVQTATAGPAAPWAGDSTAVSGSRAALDSAIAGNIRERGLGPSWTLPGDLVRTARRNGTFATDPTVVRAGEAVRRLERQRDADIPEPVASQLRALAGFHNARWALVPVELRYETGVSAGTGRAVLRVAVLDLRASRLVYLGEITGPDGRPTISAATTALAVRFADLIAP